MRSAQLATATLQLLSSTLDALDVDVAATWHRCGYCEELRPTVQAALEKLENYLAKSPVATQRALEGLEDLEGPGGFEKITLLRVIPTMTFIHFLTGKSSGILSDISSDILFDILSGISSGI